MINNLLIGDCRNILPSLPDKLVQCVVTSPPYFRLRDYGIEGQIGLEDSVEDYVNSLVNVFREVKRILKDDGTLWLNLGDSYAGSGKNRNAKGIDYGIKEEYEDAHHKGRRRGIIKKTPLSGKLKPKDLIGVPWRAAFALQDDGWYLRQDIIWNKPNVMPESVKDRCTKSHEYIFLLSKHKKYYFDYKAIQEKSVSYKDIFKNDSKVSAIHSKYNLRRDDKRDVIKHSHPQKRLNRKDSCYDITKRNKRDVWTVNTKPYTEAHFAVFPPALIQPCILAGSREGDIILDPFFGSGTVAEVAALFNRNWIGIDINEEYVPLYKKRLGLFAS
ncbi:site-specific DNA-methyltransferase [Treponema denticola]|uniref:DNA-methyltransferase n=1 Tax=Treponema denticola TaxID=158 RepID=UPI0002B598A6|nr:site-specific DNA-methyltransferase [Treponema denticola]EMB37591.1 hypothetical protein HMPREF9722_02524 [Treponema denticola ATCC 33520]